MARRIFVYLSLPLLIIFMMLGASSADAQTQILYINEILVGNASTTMDTDYTNYSSWIEIYNGGASAIDLKNYSLAYLDKGADAPITWKVPVSVSVPAQGRVIFWLDEHNKNRHANFELDMRGQWIQLLSPTNVVIDTVEYNMEVKIDGTKTLLPDISYGRQGDGGANWVYFDQPTAGTANTTPGFATPTLAALPQFSPQGGFYTGNQSVTLTTSEAGGQIRYTIDGSIPTAASSLYTGPINVTSPTVIRARVFASGKQMSLPVSHSYLINVSRNLPVVSLATKPAHLFDNTFGIYVAGTNGITGRCSAAPVNWNQKWERPASIEMYEIDGSRVIAQDIGIEIHGGCSRGRPNKSLEIKARRTYGDNDIDYQILPDKPIEEYKRIILRNSGYDSNGTLFRDALQHYLVKDMMDIDYQAYRPTVLFLNGQYWGIYNIRDKADEAFVEQNYGLDADTDFDMLERGRFVEAGSVTIWDALYSYVSSNNLNVPANYEYVKSQVDTVELMNYFITEIYVANGDWPGNNIRYWRAYDNGRWRWVLYDLDLGLSRVSFNELAYIINIESDPDAPAISKYTTLVFRKLMQNTEFRNDFVQRFASHINITYDPARVNAMINQFQAGIAPEMPAHIARWATPASISAWNTNINALRTFANGRQTHMRNHLNSYLGSPGTANLTVNISGAGDVLAAGVKIPAGGYTGPYFKTIPMSLEAVPRPGWAFVRWQETGETNSKIVVTLGGNMTRTAVFEEVGLPRIVINEIHYHPAVDEELNEFVELYNAGSSAVNLSGFTTTGAPFTFPNGTSIAPGEFILLAQTAATYAGNGYQVFQWTSGKLKNSSATITLTDANSNEIDTVTYVDEAPWPTTPDGDGPSLSLIDPALDNSLAASWAPSVIDGGSPGMANPAAPPTPGNITIVKQVVGDVPGVDWQFTGTLGAFTLPAAGGQQTFPNLTPGAFTVSETAVSGYTAAVSCTNGASGTSSVTVNLTSGADVTCTFVNSQTQPATLTIVKQVVGDVPGVDWQFTGTLGAFTLPAAGGQQTFPNLTPGAFTVSETAVSGYTATVSCTNGASGTSSVTVNLTSGADVSCTFVNTKQNDLPPTVNVCDPVPNNLIQNPEFNSGTTGWGFFTNGSGSFATSSAAPSPCAPHVRVNTTVQGSNVQLNQQGISLKPNTDYRLRLMARSSAGQDASLFLHKNTSPYTIYGVNGILLNLTTEWQTFEIPFRTSGFAAPVNDARLRIWLAPYDVNGTFYEFDNVVLVEGSLPPPGPPTPPPPPPTTASLKIVKQVVGTAPANAWQFTGTLGAFTLPAAGGQQTFPNLTPGAFTVSETAVSGYTAAVSCTNGASGTSSVIINLAAGDAVTCTFVSTNESPPPPPPPPTGGCDPVAGNLVRNPGFESGTANWSFYTSGKGAFNTNTADPAQCTHNARVAITTEGTNVQLVQTGFLLKPNTSYTLRLTARSSGGEDASLSVHRHSAPYTDYGLSSQALNLTTQWQTFEVTFTTKGFSAQTTDTRLRIWLAPYDKNGTVYEFDDVVLVEN